MRPIVHGLADKYRDRITFIYVDISDPATVDARRRLGYRATPHFVLLDADGGRLADTSGVVGAEVCEQWMTSYLLPGTPKTR